MDKLIETTREQFWYPEPYERDQWVKTQALALASGSKVLDAGAGSSKYRPYFKHCQYKTQDFCQYDGPHLKYVEPIDFVCEITSIPMDSESLDAVLCTEVFEHVVDPMAVLKEFHRILRPGGRLILTAPMLSCYHMQPYHFYAGFTRHWFEHWLPATGFDLEQITPIGGAGSSCANFVNVFYDALKQSEDTAPPARRFLSRCIRLLIKPFAHYLFPFVLRKLDDWVKDHKACPGYMVLAVKKSSEAQEA